ncbi:MAG TPA: 50S ribosomal protein L11 methyltransferase [Candidatus Methanoperedens sp.]
MLYPKGTPTQPEVISVAFSKLGLKSTDIFADIGCGSGIVSISAARSVKHVYAIDLRDEAIHATTENFRESGVTNASVLKGEASVLLPDMDIDCAFLGGSKNIEPVLDILMRDVPRFVVSAARIEIAVLALGMLKKNSRFREIVQIHLLRGYELAGGTMFRPENPVFLIAGGSEC